MFSVISKVKTSLFFLKFKLFGGGFSEIKTISDDFARRGDHEYYERLLGAYDSAVEFRAMFTERFFIGKGKGRFTLNTYRKIVSGDECFFEKIYSSASIDWRKCCFFYSNIAPGLRAEGLVIPQVLAVTAGDRLAVCLFEFIDIPFVDEGGYFDFLFSTVEKLSRFDFDALIVPEEFRALEFHFGFARCFRKTQSVLEQAFADNSTLSRMKAYCEAMPRYVGHGDLSLPNMGVDSIVIDWDNFGFYPPGFDLALGAVLRGKLLDADALNSIVERVFPSFANRCTFEMLWFSFAFFYCVFLSARQTEQKRYVYALLVERFP